MTIIPRDGRRPDGTQREAPRPTGLAGVVGEAARRRPPPTRAKTIAMVVIAAGVLVAVILTFILPYAPEAEWRREAEIEKRARTAPPEAEAETAHVAPVAPGAPRAPRATPPPTPTAVLPIPEGISLNTGRRLRMALAGLTSSPADAAFGIRSLPGIIRDAPDGDRERLDAFAVELLTSLAGSSSLGPAALDAAIELAVDGGQGLAPIAATARTKGLGHDASAPAALLFLDLLGPKEHEIAAKSVLALAANADRPLSARVLAARMVTGWALLETERKALAGDARTPPALRNALAAE